MGQMGANLPVARRLAPSGENAPNECAAIKETWPHAGEIAEFRPTSRWQFMPPACAGIRARVNTRKPSAANCSKMKSWQSR